MAKKPSSHRTTITVPMDLKERMDKVKEDINWSALACRAFETKLAEIAAKKEKKNMTDVIQRLRGSKLGSENRQYQEGCDAGREWAEDYAEVDELKRLEKARSTWFQTGFPGSSAFSAGEKLACILTGDQDMARTGMHAFWEQALGDNFDQYIYEDEYMRGFADGALAVWDEVKDKI